MIKRLLNTLITTCLLITMSTHAYAAEPVNKDKATSVAKENLVLMPLRVSENDKNLQGAMELALTEGLQKGYTVFSGERVSQKANEIFRKESRNVSKTECDETRCMQDIAIAFQSELIAIANVTKRDGGYFIALSIQNIFDNKMIFSKALPCRSCDSFQVIDRLKVLSSAADQAPMANLEEITLWDSVRNSTATADIDIYINKYPQGQFVYLANVQKKNLLDLALAKEASEKAKAKEEEYKNRVRIKPPTMNINM